MIDELHFRVLPRQDTSSQIVSLKAFSQLEANVSARCIMHEVTKDLCQTCNNYQKTQYATQLAPPEIVLSSTAVRPT